MIKKRMVFKLLGLVASLWFIYVGFSARERVVRLHESGKVAFAIPVGGYAEHRTKGDIRYSADFQFTTEDGVTVVRKKSFRADILADLKANVPVKVLYDPHDVNDFVFERRQLPWMIIAAGLLVALLILVFV